MDSTGMRGSENSVFVIRLRHSIKGDSPVVDWKANRCRINGPIWRGRTTGRPSSPPKIAAAIIKLVSALVKEVVTFLTHHERICRSVSNVPDPCRARTSRATRFHNNAIVDSGTIGA